MSKTVEFSVEFKRIVFIDMEIIPVNIYSKLLKENYITHSYSHISEILSSDMQRLEYNVFEQSSLTKDEYGNYTKITMKEFEDFKEIIGLNIYKALMKDEIDEVILVTKRL